MQAHTPTNANPTPGKDAQLTPPQFWQWGWNRNTEIWHGRLAMLLLLSLVIMAVRQTL